MILPPVSTMMMSTCVPVDWLDTKPWVTKTSVAMSYFRTIGIACTNQAAYAAAQGCCGEVMLPADRFKGTDDVLIRTNTRDHRAQMIVDDGNCLV